MVIFMEKTIFIDLDNIKDLIGTYNKRILKKELVNYLIEECFFVDKNERLKIIVNNDSNLSKNEVLNIIKNGLENEYQKSLKRRNFDNIRQIILIVLGMIFLFLSTNINYSIFKEVFLIIGWVPIWEAINIELFTDIKEKRKRKILKKILQSNIEIK